MGLSVKIPKEIYDYEEKIMFGLSWKKFLCVLFSGIWSIGVGVIGFSINLDETIIMFFIMLFSVPCFMIGWFKRGGFTFADWFLLYIQHLFGNGKFYYDNTDKLYIDLFIEKEVKKNVVSKKSKIYRKIRETQGFTGTEEDFENEVRGRKKRAKRT